jgi:hypothetical protein
MQMHILAIFILMYIFAYFWDLEGKYALKVDLYELKQNLKKLS